MLTDIKNQSDLLRYPKLGASWEGFAIEEIIRRLDALPSECYFWATHADAEIDLLIFKDGKRLGFEIKYTDAPKLSRSMNIALQDLELDSITVIYPGYKNYPLSENIHVVGLENFLKR